MLFKIISHRRFRALQEEQRKLKDQCVELETEISRYQQQEGHLDQESQKKDELLEERSASLKQMGQDFHALEEEYRQVQEQNEASMVERIELTIRDLGMSREQIKKLRDDRNELINMYIDKLYSLAKHFARTSKGLQKNRGLFWFLLITGIWKAPISLNSIMVKRNISNKICTGELTIYRIYSRRKLVKS